MKNRVDRSLRSVSLIPRLPPSIIEIKEERRGGWLKNLPFGGEIDTEPIRIEKQKDRRLKEERKVEIEVKKFMKVSNRREMKIKLKRCLQKNKKLEAKLSDMIKWISEGTKVTSNITPIKQIFNNTTKVKHLLDKEEEACYILEEPQGRSTVIPFNEKEDLELRLFMATMQNKIVTYASTFSIYSPDADNFINCLEEYKETVKQNIRTTQKYESCLKRFRYDMHLHKLQQRANEPSYYLKTPIHKLWSKPNVYFVSLSSKLIDQLQELSTIDTSFASFPFLNMYAINRLSAILRALRYCRDENINYDLFQAFIRKDHKKYLAMMRIPGGNGVVRTYPNSSEFEYLLSLKKENLVNEINYLCTLIITGGTQDFSSYQKEQLLKKEIEATVKRNLELEEIMRERMLNRPITKRKYSQNTINESRKYIDSIKKKKELELIDKQCSTGYTNKAITIS